MKSLFALLMVLSVSAALVACGGGASNGGSSQSASAPAAGGPEYGAPECDEYVKKYEACIDSKVPESGRAAVKTALENAKAGYKQAGSTAAGRAALAAGCKQALDSTKAAMAAYNCSW